MKWVIKIQSYEILTDSGKKLIKISSFTKGSVKDPFTPAKRKRVEYLLLLTAGDMAPCY